MTLFQVREKQSQTITATFRIVTPMFCSGADPSEPEFRPASFKGALRFWWRASRWPFVCQANPNSKSGALKELSETEAKVFGSSRSGQSSVNMSFDCDSVAGGSGNFVRNWPPYSPNKSGRYESSSYIGYGITESGGSKGQAKTRHREGLPTNLECRVSLRFSPLLESEWVASLEPALRLLGLFGGIGSRSRRAFGSIQLVRLNDEKIVMNSTAQFAQQYQEILSEMPLTDEVPPYSSFSNASRMEMLRPSADVFDAHEDLGEAYKKFRKEDAPKGSGIIPFGLPLTGVEEKKRRSSPFFAHIHEINDQFVPVVLFLPAHFHPDIANSDSMSFYRVVTDWMNALKGGSR